MEILSDTWGHQRMNPDEFGDALPLQQAPSAGQILFTLQVTLSTEPFDLGNNMDLFQDTFIF